jgi:hypothetical protein
MGVGYSASALHRISYLVPGPPIDPPPQTAQIFPGVQWTGAGTFRSATVAEIVAWRDSLAHKYREQLDETLDWDETNDFWAAEDIGTSEDVAVRYIAAVADEDGPRALRALAGAPKPPSDEVQRALADVEKRGFTSRFPQLLLMSSCWLPFQRNMIIEEPDWQGELRRYGSTYRLAEELTDLRTLINLADALAMEWNRDKPDEVLGAAWRATEVIARIVAVATSRQLPCWKTG